MTIKVDNRINVEIVNTGKQVLPKYETALSAGMDLRANEDVIIPMGETRLVKTGLHVAIPIGYEMQIRSRSGLAFKNSIFVLNSPGTIDSDYRGEIGIILHNSSESGFTVKEGDRVAQAVICPVVQAVLVELDEIDELDETPRGRDGFGSTGVK